MIDSIINRNGCMFRPRPLRYIICNYIPVALFLTEDVSFVGRKEKLKAKLDTMPKNFTWDELVSLMNQYGFKLLNAKRGSGRKFYNVTKERVVIFHEPHPENTLKRYVLEEVKLILDEIGHE